MKEQIMQAAGIIGLALLCGLAAALLQGCIAYRAPVIAYQRGPEVNYNQERSGNMSRSTNAEQQVAETTAEQQQQSNTTTADMPSALDATKQVGIKQGQADTSTTTQGDQSPANTTTEQVPTGQQGGDAVSVGANPISNADNAAANTAGTATNQPSGAEAVNNCATCGKPLNADGACVDGCTLPPVTE